MSRRLKPNVSTTAYKGNIKKCKRRSLKTSIRGSQNASIG